MINKKGMIIFVIAILIVGTGSAFGLSKSDYLEHVETKADLDSAYTHYLVCNPATQDYNIDSANKFGVNFVEARNKLSSYSLSRRVKVPYEVEVNEYGTCEKQIEEVVCDDEPTNESCKTTQKNIEYKCLTGTHKETKYEIDWSTFDPIGEEFKAQYCYNIRLDVTYPFDLFGTAIDNIISYAGYSFDEYAWMNASFFNETFDDTTYINTSVSTAVVSNGILYLNYSGSDATNINLNKPIEGVSDYYSGYLINDMNDGDKTGYIPSGYAGIWQVANNNEAYIIWDFGETKNFNKIIVYNWNAPDENHRNVKDFSINVSNDNLTWTTVYTNILSQEDGAGDPAAQTYNNFSAQSGRYFMFVAKSSYTSDGYRGLWEVEVYEPFFYNSHVVSKNLNSSLEIDKATLTYMGSFPSGTAASCKMRVGDETYETATNGSEVDFPTNGFGLIYNCSLTTSANNVSVRIDSITIEVVAASGGGSAANESEGGTAIQNGIDASKINGATVYNDYQVYERDTNNNQDVGTFDIFASYGSQRWAFNYKTGAESFTGLVNITPSLYVLELEDLTIAEIKNLVEVTINSTKTS